MRSIDEALQQTLNFAKNNDGIRAVILQGSLANPLAKKDIFTDIDPLFYVTDLDLFLKDDSWVSSFGEPISGFDDELGDKDKEGFWATRLRIFNDGFKIDFGFTHILSAKHANKMPLYKILLDKDGIIPTPVVHDDSKFYVKKPTEAKFHQILDEFFFDTSYVIKSLKRDELFFTKYMFHILSKKTKELISWYLGCKFEWKVNVGSEGRYFNDLLERDVWSMVLACYGGSDFDSNYEALLAHFKLVHFLGTHIAKCLNFTYPQSQENKMFTYVKTAKLY